MTKTTEEHTHTSYLLSVTLLLTSLVIPAACTGEADSSIDLIVAGDYVVIMDEKHTVVKDAAVAVDDGFIVAVGSREEIMGAYQAKQTIDGAGRVLMPGLINGHTHAAMTLLRGIADDLELMEWLTKYIFPTEVRFVDEEFVRIGTELACWEMIRGGTTTFVDMYYFPDSVANAIESCGLRVLVSPSVIDQEAPDAANLEESLSKAADFIERWKGRNNRIIPILGAHSVYAVKPEQLKMIRAKANELGVNISIHVSESRFEIETSNERFGTTPIHHLENLGFFDGPTIAAHVVWPNDDEIPVLAKNKIGVIHNPSSNMKISSGISPVSKMLEQGVIIGLGTDGPATNNDMDMWEEMRLAAFLQKVSTMDPKVLPAGTALDMATRGGASALGLGDQIGTLAVGHRADMIQVALSDVHFVPTFDVISHLVYVADEQDVTTVVVDGTVLMKDATILTIDQDRVRKEANDLAARITAGLAEQ